VAAAAPAQARPRREREEELLVWPDLVFVEFICAVLFSFTFLVISAVVNAPLINRANPDVTPNPSKAPWYFLNLQELLLHMHPALAGVIVPTVALILLAAVPYLDRSKEGQGTWFGTVNSVRITIFSTIFAAVGTVMLILYDSGKHVEMYEKITGSSWRVGEREVSAEGALVNSGRPSWLPEVGIIAATWDLIFSRDLRSIQTEWEWDSPLGKWPDSFTEIPIPLNGTSWPRWGLTHDDAGNAISGYHHDPVTGAVQPPPQWYQNLPDWLTGLFWYDLNLNLPAFVVEILIPTALMVGLPVLLIFILWRIGWVRTRRDVAISIFSGFISVYWIMTIAGAAFRGAGQELVFPWHVEPIDG
jgi:quinol-cytochrome oxidoreductase complex cytochrome b subunit